MRWHLIGPDGSIVRSAEAGSIGEARWRLGGVPEWHFVASAADYAIGYHKDITPPVPARLGRGGWYGNSTDSKTDEAIRAKLSDAVRKGLRRMMETQPEREQARRDKIAAYQRQRAADRRLAAARAANIQRGIDSRRAKRRSA